MAKRNRSSKSASPRISSTVARVPASREVLRVLFVGNSYTYANNLGDIVAGIAADPEGPSIVPTLATRGGATLKSRLENGPALKLLEGGGWNYVVLQEQSLLGGRVEDGKVIVGDPREFHESTREWARRIRQVGATPILFMTWAGRLLSRSEQARVQKKIADAYDSIGNELGVKVAPVGLAWAESARRLRTLELHIDEWSHPNPAGSYLTGLVMYSTLTGRKPTGAPAVIMGRPIYESAADGECVMDSSARVRLVDLQEAIAVALQDVAWTVSARSTVQHQLRLWRRRE